MPRPPYRRSVGGLACLFFLAWGCIDQGPAGPSQDLRTLRQAYPPAQSVDVHRSILPQPDVSPPPGASTVMALAQGASSQATDLILNGSFETGGFAPWVATVVGGPLVPWGIGRKGTIVGYFSTVAQPPHGSYLAYNGFDGSGPMEFRLEQSVVLPRAKLTLSWKDRLIWQWVSYRPPSQPRLARVELLDPVTRQVLTVLDEFQTPLRPFNVTIDTGWRPHSVDLTGYGGRAVILAFRQVVPEYYTGPGHFELDEISLIAEPLDLSPPVILPVVTGVQGTDGWYTSDVVVSWQVVDPESAVTRTVGCETVVVAEDTSGRVFTCEATSEGGTSSVSLTVKRDASPPLVRFSGNAGTYDVHHAVSIVCTAEDTLSGIQSLDCPGLVAPAWTLGLGEHTLRGSAWDRAGNSAWSETSFEVVATAPGVCTLIQNWVANRGVANSLCVKLQAIAAPQGKGETRSSAGQLTAFLQELSALEGKWLSPEQVEVLGSFARALVPGVRQG